MLWLCKIKHFQLGKIEVWPKHWYHQIWKLTKALADGDLNCVMYQLHLKIRINKYYSQTCPRYSVTIEWISAVLTRIVLQSPSFGHSYSTRNILNIFVNQIPSFGHSYSTRNILTWKLLDKNCQDPEGNDRSLT